MNDYMDFCFETEYFRLLAGVREICAAHRRILGEIEGPDDETIVPVKTSDIIGFLRNFTSVIERIEKDVEISEIIRIFSQRQEIFDIISSVLAVPDADQAQAKLAKIVDDVLKK